jgi:hypothetical protein
MFVDLFDNLMILMMIVLDLYQVTIVEISKPSPTLPKVLRSVENSLVGADQTCKEQLLQDLRFLMEFKRGWMKSCFSNWKDIHLPTPF